MTERRRTVLLTLVGPPLCGVLLACMVMAAWVGLGLPLAKGETWFTVQKVPPVAGASFTSGQPDQLQFFLVVGNDSRDPNGVGLGDAIHVIAVNPQAKAASRTFRSCNGDGGATVVLMTAKCSRAISRVPFATTSDSRHHPVGYSRGALASSSYPVRGRCSRSRWVSRLATARDTRRRAWKVSSGEMRSRRIPWT